MSKIFYDRYLDFEEIEIEIKNLNLSSEEKEEINHLIDETIHHRVLERVLTHLPLEHHADFLDKFHQAPYDETLIKYINDRVEQSVEVHIKDEMEKIKQEILKDIKETGLSDKRWHKKD